MFGTDWSDPQTLWLNLTNLALGIVTLLALLLMVGGVAHELLLKYRRAHQVAGLDAELEALLGARSGHAFHVPGLGLTMADGGEPIRPAAGKSNKEQRTRK